MVEHVALVFLRVQTAFQQIAAGSSVEFPASIMSGGHKVVPQLYATLLQRAELEVAVAIDAGIGRAALEVAFAELVHHVCTEALGVVEHVVRNAQPERNAASIFNVFE